MSAQYQPDDFYHKTDIAVRFRDLDPLNHVNNAVFNTYFEEARVRFIQTVPELKNSLKDGFSFVLAHLEISYIKPVTYDEKIFVATSILSMGNSSLTGIQALFSGQNEMKAIAETTGVWFNIKRQKPARLPELKSAEKYILSK